MRSFTKIINNTMNPYSGYGNRQAENREILCLKILNAYTRNYPCTCGSHFPTLLNYRKHSFIKLSYQGIDLRELKKKRNVIYINNLDKQIRCIYNTLKKCKIAHLDINNNGKNICINKNGTLSLIDFDIMYFRELDTFQSLTPLMLERIRRFDYCDDYNKFNNKIKYIINSCKNIICI